MPLLYDRRIVVDVAGLRITDPRIAVELERSADPSQDVGSVRIFNLSDPHAAQIVNRGERVVVQAGYPETLAVVFEGRAQRVTRRREGLAHVVTIALGDEVRSSRRLAGTYMRSWDGAVRSRAIATDIIVEGLKLGVGTIDNIPAEATFRNFYWAGGPAAAALEALLRPLGLTWYEADGLVHVNRPGRGQAEAPTIIVTPETGMVGPPVATDEGAEVRTFCEPRATLGGTVELRGSETGIAGSWKIVGFRHSLDNWEGAFTTGFDLRPLDGTGGPG